MTKTSNRTHNTRSVRIDAAGVTLDGDFTLPADARGIVVFAHGSGSSRLSPRNRRVAGALQDAGFGTLLLDLLTPTEEARDSATAELRFDIDLLAERLIGATEWVTGQSELRGMPLGYFGASTGAAAALVATALRPAPIHAIVSRGGRPDLAGAYLRRVKAPTLLIVGGYDTPVIELNRRALLELQSAAKDLVIVPGAGHLFEEPGALERVVELARSWFERHLAGGPA